MTKIDNYRTLASGTNRTVAELSQDLCDYKCGRYKNLKNLDELNPLIE